MTSDANRGALPVSPATSSPSEPRLFREALPSLARRGRSRLRDNIILLSPSPAHHHHQSASIHRTSHRLTDHKVSQEPGAFLPRLAVLSVFVFLISTTMCPPLLSTSHLIVYRYILYILIVTCIQCLGSCLLSCILYLVHCILYLVSSTLCLVSCILYLISRPI